MNWIALFSHTGTEIANISSAIGMKPRRVITNLPPGSKQINKTLVDKHNLIYTRNRPTHEEYADLFSKGDFVTLHGWMRIMPKKTCKLADIYNLHPGLITSYPELKGADPQARVFSGLNAYKRVGCVIHKVTEILDDGEVVMERSTFNDYSGEEHLSCELHDMAKAMWIDFLEYKLLDKRNTAFPY